MITFFVLIITCIDMRGYTDQHVTVMPSERSCNTVKKILDSEPRNIIRGFLDTEVNKCRTECKEIAK